MNLEEPAAFIFICRLYDVLPGTALQVKIGVFVLIRPFGDIGLARRGFSYNREFHIIARIVDSIVIPGLNLPFVVAIEWCQ
jgi:hypothetical protein